MHTDISANRLVNVVFVCRILYRLGIGTRMAPLISVDWLYFTHWINMLRQVSTRSPYVWVSNRSNCGSMGWSGEMLPPS